MVSNSYTIACIVTRSKDALYFTGEHWVPDILQACLYRPAGGQSIMDEMHQHHSDGVTCAYVIQNYDFNFDNGENWVYNLDKAKIYGLKEAEARVLELQSKN